jgi:hypothetical protein
VWFFPDEPWQYRVLDLLPSGIDVDQLTRNLRRTPSERLDAVIELMEVAEELQRGMARRSADR